METIDIDSVESLAKEINKFESYYLFRGQANASWKLESSLERVVGQKNWSKENAKKFEDFSLEKFRSKFHLYDRENTPPSSKFSWLSTMQHYGVPTRLLDFTESPYVALYFALESSVTGCQNDMALYAVNYREVRSRTLKYIKEKKKTVSDQQDKVFEEVFDKYSYEVAWIEEPEYFNARLERQQGSFLFSDNLGRRIHDVLELPHYSSTDVKKLVICSKLVVNIYDLLQKMNINRRNLFGDLDGLARSVRMDMQINSRKYGYDK